MGILREALKLWKQESQYKGSTLYKRLILFFACMILSLFFLFALIYLFFDFGSSRKKSIQGYTRSELQHVSQNLNRDFGNFAFAALRMEENLNISYRQYMKRYSLSPLSLKRSPRHIEPLIRSGMKELQNVLEQPICSSVFVMLDASVRGEDSPSRSGIFLKKIHPVATESMATKYYCLRGPAPIARDYSMELLGNWRMEYASQRKLLFERYMSEAERYPNLPVSRLYLWSRSIRIPGSNTSGFMILLPLRTDEGKVYGVCGMEFGEGLFRELYVPGGSSYRRVFTLMAPMDGDQIFVKDGLVAGNAYFTGDVPSELIRQKTRYGLESFYGDGEFYGGRSEFLKLYPVESPFRRPWRLAVLIPEREISGFISGTSFSFFLLVGVLLIVSLLSTFFISKKYLHPITKAMEAIRNETIDPDESVGVREVDELLNYLARRNEEFERELKEKDEKAQVVEEKYTKAKKDADLLIRRYKDEISPEKYRDFLDGIPLLTKRQSEIFHLYLKGKTQKEVLEVFGFTANALKYHNREIYGKLGVQNLKELLMVAALMQKDAGGKET